MINSNRFLLVSALMGAMTFAACGPDARNDSGDNDTSDNGDDDSSCVPIADFETCGGGVDDDCDGFIDCEDSDCLEAELCTGTGNDCGEVETPTASLVLPDGVGCTGGTAQLGFNSATGCESYDSPIEFAAFSNGATLPSASGIIGICAVMEHSWWPDMQIEASCPDGTKVALNRFPGRSGSGYLGIPNESDSDTLPGTGWEYCWAPTGGNGTMFSHSSDGGTLPAGDYTPDDSFDAFVGCPLNGEWAISVQDRWGIDNGFIFSWTVKFDPELFRAECQID